jgi:hypothetical protein
MGPSSGTHCTSLKTTVVVTYCGSLFSRFLLRCWCTVQTWRKIILNFDINVTLRSCNQCSLQNSHNLTLSTYQFHTNFFSFICERVYLKYLYQYFNVKILNTCDILHNIIPFKTPRPPWHISLCVPVLRHPRWKHSIIHCPLSERCLVRITSSSLSSSSPPSSSFFKS